MPVHIAHLSDLHFGKAFDAKLWRSVSSTVIRCRPHLIIVSGDLVDHPIPENMRKASEELNKLAKNASAELHVVPGNHDLFYWGNDTKSGRVGLFDQIFGRTDPQPAPVESVGFGSRPVGLIGACWNYLFKNESETAQVRPRQSSGPIVRELDSVPVLLALLDSNAAEYPIGLATGSVSSDDLLQLDDELNKCKKHHLARIAVLHHHVLPIAHSAGKIVGAEPFMVLQNAGDLLSVLARHRFDLVLHGHKHKAQFARIDFTPETSDGYPIAVVSAGSACLRKRNEPRFNSFNLLKIADNGAITVQAFFYGHNVAPLLDGNDGEARRTFSEPLEGVKRRAFARASERHRICCDKREWTYEISKNGDLRVRHEVSGLRVVRGFDPVPWRPHRVSVPERGRIAIDLHLDDRSKREGYRVIPSNDLTNSRGIDLVALPGALGDGTSAHYIVELAYANTIMMTAWEARERRAEPPEEWVGVRIWHPLKQLVLNLKLPAESLVELRPYVRCERPLNFPRYEIDQDDDAILPDGTEYEIDRDMQEEENKQLHFDIIKGAWKAVIEQPLVGYIYQLRWEIPGERPREPIPSETAEWRRLLLDMVQRTTTLQANDFDREAARLFALLTEELGKLLGRSQATNAHLADLFAYDGERLCLRQVICSDPNPLPARAPAFEIKLGDGVAGAAFQQRRIVPWSRGDTGPAFIRPVPYPHRSGEVAMPFSAMLSIPIFHPTEQDNPHPSPWSVIAVVGFATTEASSRIPAMLNPPLSQENEDALRDARGLAQSMVYEILTTLGNNRGR